MTFQQIKKRVASLTLCQSRELLEQITERIHSEARRTATIDDRMTEYVRVMQSFCRFDIMATRHNLQRWALDLVVYQLYIEGYTLSCIGALIGSSRNTVYYKKNRGRDITELPSVYPNEYSTWVKFQNTINHDIH